MSSVSNLKSSEVFKFFETINKIPRASYKEEEISKYLVNFAKERNLEYSADEMFNVIIKKTATNGYENSPSVAIQSHIDMVCTKNKGTEHDFSKDPIQVIYEDDLIRANGTTLGADNGIAVAMTLAILDSNDIPHPPIEAIFTTCEEVGMNGANFLDCININSKILLNIDSDEEGIFTVGCAGGMKVTCHIPIKYEETPSDFKSYSIFINGLKGGHSGIDILQERANSNIILARTLNFISKQVDFKLNSISGGTQDNAIPREAEAIISISNQNLELVKNIIDTCLITYKNEFSVSDPNINIIFKEVNKEEKCLTSQSLKNSIASIMLTTNGVDHMSMDIINMPESSNNLGIVECDENEVRLICALRSSKTSRKYLIAHKLELLTSLVSGYTEIRSEYPAWEYNPNSYIRNKLYDIYKNMFKEDPKINIIHAGLECGIFTEKIEGLDAISFGPNLLDIHTPQERASISSIDRVWCFLLKILKEIK